MLAEADSIQTVDGYPYFPPEAVRWDHLRAIDKTSVCAWKGTASYYDVVVGDDVNAGAAWVYRDPKPAAAHLAGHVGFWKGVEVA